MLGICVYNIDRVHSKLISVFVALQQKKITTHECFYHICDIYFLIITLKIYSVLTQFYVENYHKYLTRKKIKLTKRE